MKKINLQDLVGLINEQKEVMNEQGTTKVLRRQKVDPKVDPAAKTQITKKPSEPSTKDQGKQTTDDILPLPPMNDQDEQNAEVLYSVFQKFAPEGKVGQFFQEFKKLYGSHFQPSKVSSPAKTFIGVFHDLRMQAGIKEDPRLEDLYTAFKNIFDEEMATYVAEQQKKEGK